MADTTLDLYTQAVSSQKREANAKVVEMLLPAEAKGKKPQHHSTLSEEEKEMVEAVNC